MHISALWFTLCIYTSWKAFYTIILKFPLILRKIHASFTMKITPRIEVYINLS